MYFQEHFASQEINGLIGSLVNAIIFLAPISAFDQVLAEVCELSRVYGDDSDVRPTVGPICQPFGRFYAPLETRRVQPFALECQHNFIPKQMRFIEGILVLPVYVMI